MTVTPPAARIALVPLVGGMWGLNWPAVKLVLGEVAPWTFRCMGLLLGGMLLASIALWRGSPLRIPRAYWPPLAAAALLSIAGFNVLLAFAQLAAPTARAAIVTYTMPIWAALFARLLLGERLDRRRQLGLALGAIGLLALGLPLFRTGQFSIGLVFALLGGMSWAAGTVVTKRYPVPAPALAIAAWQLLLGGLIAGLGMLVFEGVPVPHALGPAASLALLYHVLFAQAFAYVLWFAIIAHVPAGLAALGTLIAPAVGVSSAMLILGERPALADYLGLALIVAAAASILLPVRAASVAPALR